MLTLLSTWTMEEAEVASTFERCAHARPQRRPRARLVVSPPASRQGAQRARLGAGRKRARPPDDSRRIRGRECGGLARRRLEALRQGSAGDEIDCFSFVIAMFGKCVGEIWGWDFMEVSGAAALLPLCCRCAANVQCTSGLPPCGASE